MPPRGGIFSAGFLLSALVAPYDQNLLAGKGGDGQDETTTKAAHYRFMRPIMRHERQLGGHLTDGAY